MELEQNLANLILTNNYDLGAPGIYTSVFEKTINLRTLLGPAYYECDTFEICLNNYSSSIFMDVLYLNGANISSGRPCKLAISGLEFIGNTYNGQPGLAFFPPCFFVSGSPTLLNSTFRSNNFSNPERQPLKFKKPANDVVTLTFAIYLAYDTTSPVSIRNQTDNLSINQLFAFSVFGLKNNNKL